MNPVDILESKFAQMSSDPEFMKLNYQDQAAVRTNVTAAILPQDPDYANLSPEQKQAATESIARRVPALQNKTLEGYLNDTVRYAHHGDMDSAQKIAELSGWNATSRNSLIVNLAAKVSGAVGVPIGGTDLTTKESRSLMDGSDAAKLQAYFNDIGANDSTFKSVRSQASAGAFVGQLGDFAALLGAPGSAVTEGLMGVVRGVNLTSRLALNTAKLIIPAVSNTMVGAVGNIARENALALIQNNPGLYTDTATKLLAAGGEGAYQNFFLSLGLQAASDFVLPGVAALLRGPIRDTSLNVRTFFWNKIANPALVDSLIKKAGGIYALPDETIQLLNPYVKDTAWLRNFRANAAVGDFSTIDLRPLDKLAVASPDLPDVVFAPKDWKNPTTSGFTIWEMKAVPGAAEKMPKFQMVDEASSLGELQSKLADKAAMRYDGLTAVNKADSMTLSKDLVLQGKLQQLNSKTYDPFPEEVSKGFIRPKLRGYLSPTEAQDAAYAAIGNGGNAFHVKLDETPQMVRKIAANESFLTDGAPLTLVPTSPENANALAIISNPATPEALTAAQAFADKAVAANSGWTADTARAHYLVQNGYDGIFDPDTGTIQSFFPSRMKWITDQFDSATGKLLPSTKARLMASGPLGTKVSIQAKIATVLGKDSLAASPTTLANVAMSKFKGELKDPDVKNFVTQIVDAKGVAHTDISIQRGLLEDSGIVKNPDGSLTVKIPDNIASFQDQKTFVTKLLKGMDDLGTGKIDKLAKIARTKAINSAPSKFTLPFESESANHAWLQSVAKSEFSGVDLIRNTDGGYSLQDKAYKTIGTFDTLAEARDAMLMSSLSESFLKGDLYRQGYRLSGDKKVGYTLGGPGLAHPIHGDSIQDVIKTIDYKPSTISNRLAPRDIDITPGTTRVTFDGNKVVASRQEVAQALDKFENPDELAKMVGVAKLHAGDIYKVADDYVRVDVPGLGVTRYFNTVSEAKAFLETDFNSMSALKSAANRKGISIYHDYNTGGYILGDGEKVLNAKNASEVQTILKSYPDTPGAREILSALDPQADEAVKQAIELVDRDMMREWKTGDFGETAVRWDASILDEKPSVTSRGLGKMSLLGQGREHFGSYDRYTETTVNRELKLTELGKLRDMSSRQAQAMYQQLDDDIRLHEAIFTDEKGREMKVDRRQAIAAYIEAEGIPESLPETKAKFGELSTHEESVMQRVKDLFKEYAKRFGVDPSTYIKGYMSHIRASILADPNIATWAIDADDVLGNTYHGLENAPKPLRAFFHHERAEALLDASMESDPLAILNRYVTQGNKEFFLRQPIQDTLDYFRRNGGNIPSDVIEHTLYDIQSMANGHKMQGFQEAQSMLDSFHAALSKMPGVNKFIKDTPGGSAKLLQGWINLTYLGKVAFRPWLAARNIIQVEQTLGCRIGFEPTNAALKQVLGEGREELMLRLRKQGLLLRDTPAAADLGQSRLSKLTRAGMNGIYAADDIARAVSCVAAENLLQEGVDTWNRGAFERISRNTPKGAIEKFKDFTELRQISAGKPELADQIAELALSGKSEELAQAKKLFAQELSNQTNPNFARFQQPHFYTASLPGYLFGRLSTFTTMSRENIFRGWQASQGIANKALFIGRYVGLGLALKKGMEAIGIDGKDFSPGYSALFGGGPQFSEAIDLARSAGSGTTNSNARETIEKAYLPFYFDESQGKLQGNLSLGNPEHLPGSIPGTLQLHYAHQMALALERDDYWKAFLCGLTIPVKK